MNFDKFGHFTLEVSHDEKNQNTRFVILSVVLLKDSGLLGCYSNIQRMGHHDIFL